MKKQIFSSGFKKYFKNTSWVLFEKIFKLFSSLFIGIWVTRYLGASNFGVLSYAQSFVAIFASIAALGLDGILVRELVRYKKENNEIIVASLFIRILGALLTIVLINLTLMFTNTSEIVNLMVMIISFSIIFKISDVFVYYFQSLVKSKFTTYSNLISNLISSLIKIGLIYYDSPLINFAYVILFDSFILFFFLLFFFFNNSSLRSHNFTFVKFRATYLLTHSWPILLGGIVVAITLKIDQLIISWILGNESVGIYAAATRLSEAWYFIPAAISGSLFPAIINAKKIDKKLYENRFQKLLNFLVVLALIVAIPMTFLSDSIINLLYGIEFIKSADVLMVHIWSGVFIFLSIANGNWLINENLQFYYFISMTIGLFVNIFLNLIFIERFGIVGAAWSNLITYLFSGYICLSFFKKTRPSFIYLTKSLFLYDIANKLIIKYEKLHHKNT